VAVDPTWRAHTPICHTPGTSPVVFQTKVVVVEKPVWATQVVESGASSQNLYSGLVQLVDWPVRVTDAPGEDGDAGAALMSADVHAEVYVTLAPIPSRCAGWIKRESASTPATATIGSTRPAFSFRNEVGIICCIYVSAP
jgi:hypothetical protein